MGRPNRQHLSMAASEKHHAIEYIFEQLWDPGTQTLTRTAVTMAEVLTAIEWSNANRGTTLSPRNPANFMKDVVRGFGGSRMWPQRLKDLRWTAIQKKGGSHVFEFVRYEAGQDDPFPNPYSYDPTEVNTHHVQSLSIPQATKELGRDDETYLIQVAAKLAVVETHFALESPLKGRMLHIQHIQVGVKLRHSEIDSLYLATCKNAAGHPESVLITAEAKKKRQRILEEQIEGQVRGAFRAMPHIGKVIPIAMQSVTRGVYIVEFKAVDRADLDTFTALESVAYGFYELVPAVKGI